MKPSSFDIAKCPFTGIEEVGTMTEGEMSEIQTTRVQLQRCYSHMVLFSHTGLRKSYRVGVFNTEI